MIKASYLQKQGAKYRELARAEPSLEMRRELFALAGMGHGVEMGSRALRRTGSGLRVRRAAFQQHLTAEGWEHALDGVDVVVVRLDRDGHT